MRVPASVSSVNPTTSDPTRALAPVDSGNRDPRPVVMDRVTRHGCLNATSTSPPLDPGPSLSCGGYRGDPDRGATCFCTDADRSGHERLCVPAEQAAEFTRAVVEPFREMATFVAPAEIDDAVWRALELTVYERVAPHFRRLRHLEHEKARADRAEWEIDRLDAEVSKFETAFMDAMHERDEWRRKAIEFVESYNTQAKQHHEEREMWRRSKTGAK
jgi:hypothetical protein